MKIIANKKFKIILAVEAVMALILCMLLFIRTGGQEIGASEFCMGAGGYDSQYSAWIIGDDTSGDMVAQTGTFSLKPGVYRMHLYYDADTDRTNAVTVVADEVDYGALLTNAVTLASGLHETDYRVYVREQIDNLKITVNYGGSGTVKIYGAELVGTNAYVREALAILLALSLIVDILYALYLLGYFTKRRINISAALLMCALIASIPALKNYIYYGADILYHLIRIDGIVDGIVSGQFPTRVYPEWLFGYGYLDGAMYGNVLLYIPAAMRAIGFTVIESYNTFEVLINIATVLVAYFSFKKMFKNDIAGIICTYLYVLMPYRLYCLYLANYVGTYSAAVFWPLLIYGMYRIFVMDTDSKKYSYSWVICTLAISGIAGSHLLSTELAAYSVVLTCMVLIKRVFKPKRFLELLKTLVASVLMNLWYIIPFVDSYMSNNIHVKYVFARTIQHRGLELMQFFDLFITTGNHTFFGDEGLQNANNMTVGLPLMCALLVFIWLVFAGKEVRKSRYYKVGIFFAAGSILLVWMCSLYFPWDYIQNMNGLFRKLVSSMQFSTRFLIVLGFLLTALSGCVYVLLKDGREKKIFGYTTVGLAIIAALYYAAMIPYSIDPLRIYDMDEVGTGYVSGAEYIPESIISDVNGILTYRDAEASDNVSVSDYNKKYLSVNAYVANDSDYSGYVNLPMINYKGYTAKNVDTGEKLQIEDGQRAEVSVIIPPGFDGNIQVKYTGMWYWRVGDIISLLTIIGTIIYIVWKIKNARSKKD